MEKKYKENSLQNSLKATIVKMIILMNNNINPGDIILYFSLFQQSNQGKPDCDFLNQKVWICIWEILNLVGLLALIVALGE